jgi:hypothetical protein
VLTRSAKMGIKHPFVVYPIPVFGIDALPRTPLLLTLTRALRGPADTLTLFLPRFTRTPGASLMLLRNLKPNVVPPSHQRGGFRTNCGGLQSLSWHSIRLVPNASRCCPYR